MSGFLVIAGNATDELHRVQLELMGESGREILEAVRRVKMWQQWAAAYRFVSLMVGEESLRQRIFDYYQRLSQY